MRLCRLPAKESHGSASQESPTPPPDGGFIGVWHFGLTQSKTRALNSPGGCPRNARLDQRMPVPSAGRIPQHVQYTSIEFGRRCHDAGVRLSMGSVGDAHDNAMCAC